MLPMSKLTVEGFLQMVLLKGRIKYEENFLFFNLFLIILHFHLFRILYIHTYFFDNIIQIESPSKGKLRNLYKLKRDDVT